MRIIMVMLVSISTLIITPVVSVFFLNIYNDSNDEDKILRCCKNNQLHKGRDVNSPVVGECSPA